MNGGFFHSAPGQPDYYPGFYSKAAITVLSHRRLSSGKNEKLFLSFLSLCRFERILLLKGLVKLVLPMPTYINFK